MIKHKVLTLDEQKYVGIKTIIQFQEHDDIDFKELHLNVLGAEVFNIDYSEHFIALDSDFTKSSFSYTPLVPVKSFENNDDFVQFTREGGTYYGFSVVQKDCNPNWFKTLAQYIKENDLTIERSNYDLEYYEKDYLTRIDKDEYCFEEEVFMILLKKKE